MNGPNPSGLCMCGCGARTNIAARNCTKRGDVKGTPRRYLVGHMHRKRPERYFVEDRGYETPCWVFVGGLTGDGYGQMSMHGRSGWMAHRVYYERLKGPIPVGLDLDHLCRVRACVNPDHLEPVTRAENLRRGRGKVKLTFEQAVEIHLSRNKRPCDLARRYGVAEGTIYALWNGLTWRDAGIEAQRILDEHELVAA